TTFRQCDRATTNSTGDQLRLPWKTFQHDSASGGPHCEVQHSNFRFTCTGYHLWSLFGCDEGIGLAMVTNGLFIEYHDTQIPCGSTQDDFGLEFFSERAGWRPQRNLGLELSYDILEQ